MAADSLLSTVKTKNSNTTTPSSNNNNNTQQHQSITLDLNEITRIPTHKKSHRSSNNSNRTKKSPFSSSSGLDIITTPPPNSSSSSSRTKRESKRCCRHLFQFILIMSILIFSLRRYSVWISDSFSVIAAKEQDNVVVVDGIGVGERSEDSLGTKFDLNIGNVDHWCLNGDDDSCTCLDPTEATPNIQSRLWLDSHQANKDLIKETVMSEYLSPANLDSDGLDVVFLGDSIIEEWNGRWLGRDREELEEVKEVFDKMFRRRNGGKVEGLALGIAGDAAPNLLWRIQNGEMPDNLNPSIWWILIGTNDFGTHHCSGEIVFMGIQRIVEEIMHRKPHATKIVINSILPRTSAQDGKLVNGTVAGNATMNVTDLWPNIDAVNHELKHFCKQHKQLEYFDGGYLFLGTRESEIVERSDGYILEEMMRKDHVHPSVLGHKLWGSAIVKRLVEILKLEDEDEDGGGDDAR